MKQHVVTPRQRCDLELLMHGGFAPLQGFMGRADYESVLETMHLADGSLWPMPITLDVSEVFAETIEEGEEIALMDTDGALLATLCVTDRWKPDFKHEALKVFGTPDMTHPGVGYLFSQANPVYLGGTVRALKAPPHYDFPELRYTPAELKEGLKKSGLDKIVGFQTRNPLHRAHMELTMRAAREVGAHLLLHPVVGATKPGDVDHITRVRCYQKLLPYYPKGSVTLSLLPLAMRMAGPRSALWHGLIRKNYGCTHFIVGRDHAGPGSDSTGKPFYSPYAAQELFGQYQEEAGIRMVAFPEMVYVKERRSYHPVTEIKKNETPLSISGTQLRDALTKGTVLPDWFSFPEVMEELREAYPARHKQGLTLFFTGLSGAGKTTLAHALYNKLLSYGKRNVTLLDGDVARRELTKELGFSRADRNTNVERIGYVASEVTKVGGIAICAVIAPYEEARLANRLRITKHGGYVEVYISTPLAVCEDRDVKGLYAKVRKGEIKGFTGIDDPYETPANPEIVLDTSGISVEAAAMQILQYLVQQGYLEASLLEPVMEGEDAGLAQAVG